MANVPHRAQNNPANYHCFVQLYQLVFQSKSDKYRSNMMCFNIKCTCTCLPGVVAARRCMNVLYFTCAMPVAQVYMGMSGEQVMEKLRSTDLSETCEYVHVLAIYVQIYTHNKYECR